MINILGGWYTVESVRTELVILIVMSLYALYIINKGDK